MRIANVLVKRPRTVGVAPSDVAYSGSRGSMIETPTWVMNAIVPSSAIAGLSPRSSDRIRSAIDLRSRLTWPCSQGASTVTSHAGVRQRRAPDLLAIGAYSSNVTLPSPQGPPTPRPSGPSAPTPPRSGLPGRISWGIFLVLLVWNAFVLFGTGTSSSVELPYSAFLAQAKLANVDQVTFDGQVIDGTFRHPIQWPQASAAPGSNGATSPVPVAAPGAGQAAPQTYTSFSTIEPPDGDPALLPLLEAQNVTIIAKNVGGGSFLLDLIIGILPVALIIGVIVYMGRQMQRSQQGIFGFGGSRARLYDAEKPNVTFADVAGEDQAKIEVVDFLKKPDRYKRLGARLPRGVLLIGPPGTGKTLLARAVAGEAHVPFFSISASEFVELFVGVGASRVRDLFQQAKAAAPSIVFVDEIDAVGKTRAGAVIGGHDEREQTRV